MRSYLYNVQVEIPFNLTLDERELMNLEMRLLDNYKPSKRDIGYMLRYVYVQKKWFFYQKEKKDLKILSFNYKNYPNLLLKNRESNIRKKQHALHPIHLLINKRKQKRQQRHIKRLKRL